MVAYSFKTFFAPKILDGTKRQTIRADRRRHARPGEEVQLYTGLRTKQCRLIARAKCENARLITLCFLYGGVIRIRQPTKWEDAGCLHDFARADGFESWPAMVEFWREQHGAINEFEGVLITWGPIQ